MRQYEASFGIGFLAGLRSLSACAALAWIATHEPRRGLGRPAGAAARGLVTTAALAEMAGDKMPFAPDRRIPPSFALRLALGAVGGWMLAGRRASPEIGALAGLAGAVSGTLLGRAARGPGGPADWPRMPLPPAWPWFWSPPRALGSGVQRRLIACRDAADGPRRFAESRMSRG